MVSPRRDTRARTHVSRRACYPRYPRATARAHGDTPLEECAMYNNRARPPDQLIDSRSPTAIWFRAAVCSYTRVRASASRYTHSLASTRSRARDTRRLYWSERVPLSRWKLILINSHRTLIDYVANSVYIYIYIYVTLMTRIVFADRDAEIMLEIESFRAMLN